MPLLTQSLSSVEYPYGHDTSENLWTTTMLRKTAAFP